MTPKRASFEVEVHSDTHVSDSTIEQRWSRFRALSVGSPHQGERSREPGGRSSDVRSTGGRERRHCKMRMSAHELSGLRWWYRTLCEPPGCPCQSTCRVHFLAVLLPKTKLVGLVNNRVQEAIDRCGQRDCDSISCAQFLQVAGISESLRGNKASTSNRVLRRTRTSVTHHRIPSNPRLLQRWFARRAGPACSLLTAVTQNPCVCRANSSTVKFCLRTHKCPCFVALITMMTVSCQKTFSNPLVFGFLLLHDF